MNELQRRIREKARYLDADIHRELTIEEAEKELATWSKDKIEDEDLFIRLSELKKILADYRFEKHVDVASKQERRR